jgi:hypothetical protein
VISGRGRTLGAATASGVAGVGFGLPCVFGIRHLANTGEVWHFLGFPTYGDGPFGRVGIATTVSLLAGFLAVCVAEVLLGVSIAHRSPWSAEASAALLPIELAYWIGFALPIGLVLGAARFILLRRELFGLRSSPSRLATGAQTIVGRSDSRGTRALNRLHESAGHVHPMWCSELDDTAHHGSALDGRHGRNAQITGHWAKWSAPAGRSRAVLNPPSS